MTLRAATATVTLLLSSIFATAQQPVPQFTDPANLRGERVKPRDGRELPIDEGARGLEQMLRKLNTRASLMLIVAHPDDEDGGMLTYYSRGLGARVAVLTLTRGEGGQNAMTGDFEDALGLLRTQELLSADRYLGVDQFFGTEVDFGFSKTKEEAFKKWTHERVLYDAVRSIRLYRPLVIAAVFIGGVTDGHGQHQVSGQIAQEAFKAAADPTVFPDMIAEGILPWQALKVYARVPMQSISSQGLYDYATGKYTAPRFENYVTGEVTTTTPTADVVVHEGTVDPILSDNPSGQRRTYIQFARIGLGMQKSQIGGGIRVPPAGKFDVAYHLYGSALTTSSAPPVRSRHPERSEGPAIPPATARPLEPSSHNPEAASFFDGIDTSIEGIASLAPNARDQSKMILHTNLRAIAHSIDEAQLDLRPGHPELAAKRLSEAVTLTGATMQTIESFSPEWLPVDQKKNVLHELQMKRIQLNDALCAALGLSLDATSSDGPTVLAGASLSIHTSLKNLSGTPVQLLNEQLIASSEIVTTVGTTNNSPDATDAAKSLASERDLVFPADHSRALTRPHFHRVDIEQPYYDLGKTFEDRALRNAPTSPPALTAWVALDYSGVRIDLGRLVHFGLQPIAFGPAASLSLSTHAQVLSRRVPSATIRAFLSPVTQPAVEPRLLLPTGWRSHAANSNDVPGETGFVMQPPASTWRPATITASATLVSGATVTEGYHPIGYGDLPRTNYYTPATVRIVPVDLNLPANHRIGYLPGTGDAVPEALASIDLKPDTLTVADLTAAKLAQYDTVILGVRTYAAHPDLHGAPTQALLDYARNGGNVLVQYQTTEFSGADAPYPLDLGSNERVVDETDPVQLLHPDAPFLATPNRITPADFNNWVEERGHGFLSTWDSRYTALTETHDPDEDPQRGGLITTDLGKGRWTYCAFALYRQLPEAVPGAFRLFVNLITPATSKN